jgi:hypothetical protein
MAKFPLWAVGKKGDATTFDQMVPNIVTKVATNSIVSNVTLANDSELTGIALGIGTWEIEVMLWATGVAAGASNLKTGWAFTGTLTGTPNRALVGPAATNTAVPTAITLMNMSTAAYNSTTQIYGLGSATVPAVALEICPNFVVSVAGTLSIQVAQGTSNATATVIQPGSRVKVRQIA